MHGVIPYLLKTVPTQAAENLSHLSAPEITHTISAFVCLPRVTAHQLPGSVDDYTSHTHTHLTHTLHTRTDSPPPLPPRPVHIHHNYAQQEFQIAPRTSEQRNIAPISPPHYTAQTKQGAARTRKKKSISVISVYRLYDFLEMLQLIQQKSETNISSCFLWLFFIQHMKKVGCTENVRVAGG